MAVEEIGPVLRVPWGRLRSDTAFLTAGRQLSLLSHSPRTFSPRHRCRLVDTDRIMAIALELAGQDRLPADSAIFVPGMGLREVMMGIDVDSGEILPAKGMGVDGGIA